MPTLAPSDTPSALRYGRYGISVDQYADGDEYVVFVWSTGEDIGWHDTEAKALADIAGRQKGDRSFAAATEPFEPSNWTGAPIDQLARGEE